MKPVIVLDNPFLPSKYIKLLQQLKNASVTYYNTHADDQEQAVARLQQAQIIVVDVVFEYKQILRKLPKLETIITTSVGVDHIDLEYCAQKGIEVINFPGFNARSVAEMAFANLISLLRHIPRADSQVRNGSWLPELFYGHELQGKKLGLLGAGNIGREVIKIAQGLSLEVLCHTLHPTQSRAKTLKLKSFYTLKEVLTQADFLVIAIPATPETENLLNRQTLAVMKPSAYLINVARWQIISALDLAEALYQGKLAGAALDVIAPEPFDVRKQDPRLQEMVNSANVIITPHIASVTDEAIARLGEGVVQAVQRLVRNA